MKGKIFFIAALCLLGILLAGKAAHAEVGVGMSPSKIVLQIEGGTSQDFEFLVFNSGDYPLDISLGSDGDISKFTKVETSGVTLQPEPKPHELPIKNGQNFKVTFTPPVSGETKVYTGTINAAGSPAKGAQFGGSVGVAALAQIIVVPPTSIFSYITPTYQAIILIAAIILAVMFLMKRAGFKISVQRQR